MRYHNITKDDMLNGEGLRVVLWVAGCTHACPQCHNPFTWDINGGIPFDPSAFHELCQELDKEYISGLTLSGGDPLHPQNRKEIQDLAAEIRRRYPNKTIWLYTGFLWDEICSLPVISLVDVVVDGEFKIDLLDNSLHWKGSSNQRVIDAKASLAAGKVVLYQDK